VAAPRAKRAHALIDANRPSRARRDCSGNSLSHRLSSSRPSPFAAGAMAAAGRALAGQIPGASQRCCGRESGSTAGDLADASSRVRCELRLRTDSSERRGVVVRRGASRSDESLVKPRHIASRPLAAIGFVTTDSSRPVLRDSVFQHRAPVESAARVCRGEGCRTWRMQVGHEGCQRRLRRTRQWCTWASAARGYESIIAAHRRETTALNNTLFVPESIFKRPSTKPIMPKHRAAQELDRRHAGGGGNFRGTSFQRFMQLFLTSARTRAAYTGFS